MNANAMKPWMAAAAMVALTGVAQAAPSFQGRLADGTASATCTVSGSGKCAMFYNATLDITILNNFGLTGFWSASAAAGSAQQAAESAGFAATGLTGWLLPTGVGTKSAGAENQWLAILNDLGGNFLNLVNQFDGAAFSYYWSRDAGPSGFQGAARAWQMGSNYPGYGFSQAAYDQSFNLNVVAVRNGDVTAPIPHDMPEPSALALMALALGAALAGRSRRPA